MTANGFDSVERVAKWTRALREAAQASMITPASLDQTLRDSLAAIYRRLIEKGGIARYHPGIERFTLERIRPELRSELDRRIVASTDLIRLNREQAIDKTIQRFSGWSTSIPKGGTSAESKAETKQTVRKSLAGLPFEERRVLIDQGHKLTAAISEILATDGGAIAGRWRSHYRQPGYDYREDHKERDDKVFLVRDSWAHVAGLVKKGRVGYVDESTTPGQEPFCRCYYIWLYNLRDLPDDMLTGKGKAGLGAARAQVQAMGARADAQGDDPKRGIWHLSWMRPNAFGGTTTGTWCNRMQGGYSGGMNCTTEAAQVTCKFCQKKIATLGMPKADEDEDFDKVDVNYSSSIPVPVDRDHDVEWMAVLARDGKRLYVDRTLPREVEIKGRAFDPALLLWAHEHAEFVLMLKVLASFLSKYLRQPTEVEKEAIYNHGHEHGGIPAERAEAKRLGVDWDAWEAWSRGELARLEHRPITRPPPDPHVKPALGDANQPIENLAAMG